MNTIGTLFDGNIAYAFAWTMIHSLWQCALIALALAISLRFTRNHSASLRYLQSILALLICVIAGGTTFYRHYDGISDANQIVQSLGTDLHVTYAGGLWEHIYVTLNDSLDYIVLLWMAGFLIQFYRYGYDFVMAYTLKRKGCEIISDEWQMRFNRLALNLNITKTFTVKYSCHITSICNIGHFKPVILLPIGLLTSMPSDQVEALILHELAHIRRNDYLVNAMQCLVKLLYFFNPAVLWISSKIDVERENACDDIAVKECGNPALYAYSLANISELELKMTTLLAAKKSNYQILPRVKRLFSKSAGISKSMEQLVSAVCVSLVLLAMNVSAEDFDFIRPDNRANFTADQSTGITLAVAPATSAKEVAKPEITAEPQIPQKTETRNGTQPAAPTPLSPPENPKPVIVLKASPEIDYASRHLAMNDTDAGSPAQRNSAMRLAVNMDDTQTKSGAKLEPVNTPDFTELLVASNFKVPLSRKIYVAEAKVDFADIWMTRFRADTSTRYRKQIVDKFGATFVDELKGALVKSGWEVTETQSADSLVLKPRLLDIYIAAPDSPGIKQTIVKRVGQGAIELVFETPDAQPFMKITDYRNTPDSAGSPFVANQATNFYYFKLLMTNWSERTIQYLDELMKIVESKN